MHFVIAREVDFLIQKSVTWEWSARESQEFFRVILVWVVLRSPIIVFSMRAGAPKLLGYPNRRSARTQRRRSNAVVVG
jgi:hypothetical protein